MQVRAAKKSIAVFFAMIMALSSFSLMGCSNGNASEEAGSGSEVAAMIDVTVFVDISAAIAEEDSTALKLEETQGAKATIPVSIPENGTVLDALEATGLDFTATPSTLGDYITAIGGLANGTVGPTSGWTFLINGELSMDAVGNTPLKAGDTVLWQFVTSFE